MVDIIKQINEYNIVLYGQSYKQDNMNLYLLEIDEFDKSNKLVNQYRKYLQIGDNDFKILSILLERNDFIEFLINSEKVITKENLHKYNIW